MSSSAGHLTPNLFMDGASMSSKVLVRYRLIEHKIRLMGEIGADSVLVTGVGPAMDEVLDFRLQVSIYDQVFVRSAFDLAERGADVQLEVLVMRALGKSRTLVTRLSGSCSQAQPSGRSNGAPPMEIAGRLRKIFEEEVKQSMSDAFRLHKVCSN